MPCLWKKRKRRRRRNPFPSKVSLMRSAATVKKILTAVFNFSDEKMIVSMPPASDDDEENMLKRAIAMSLEEE